MACLVTTCVPYKLSTTGSGQVIKYALDIITIVAFWTATFFSCCRPLSGSVDETY